MRFSTLFVVLMLALVSFAQDARQLTDINKKGSSFELGVELYSGSKDLFFNAYSTTRGHQLYSFDGDQASLITHFDDSYLNEQFKEDEQSPIALGAVGGNFHEFNQEIFFFAQGEMTEAGLYAHKNGILRKVFSCSAIGDHFVEQDRKLIFEAELSEDQRIGNEKETDSVGRRVVLMQVNLLGNTGLYAKLKSPLDKNFSDKMLVFGERILLERQGIVYRVRGKFIVEDERFKDHDEISDLFVFKDRLYFNSIKNGEAEKRLHSINETAKEEDHGNILPNRLTLNPIDPLVTEELVFFTSNHGNRGVELYRFDGKNRPKMIQNMSFREAHTHFEDLAFADGQLLFTAKVEGENNFSIYQSNMDTVIKLKIDELFDYKGVAFMDHQLIFSATSRRIGRELYRIHPLLSPRVRDHHFVAGRYNEKGYNVGKVDVLNSDDMRVRFAIVEGNMNDIFTINEISGMISLDNVAKIDPNKQREYYLKVRVSNRQMSSFSNVSVKIKPSEDFSFVGLEEKFMFFPDFSRKNVLTTTNLPDGTIIKVYNTSRQQIDQIVVTDGAIELGTYPAGIYLLNVKGKDNYYQRIELQ